MQDLWNMRTATFDAASGSSVEDCIQEAIDFSKENGCHKYGEQGTLVSFEFNDVTVSVRSDSNPELIYRDWSRAINDYIDKNVGPYPNPVLTDEEKENDARIKAENEQHRQQWQAEYQAQADAKRNATEAKLADAPEMEIADQEIWENYKSKNQGDYGHGIITYAERWARLMQVEMAAGKKLEDIADTTSYEADIDGISGYMYSAAVHTLVTNWKHGDRLRKWYNEQYGVDENTEGTVNPAIIIGTD
ncbi:hypothetical protein H6792_03625 [Candidatus Nomurabacteria bacterium]|nr:hypothetical protein [Candidatus Nomurabacteria bacterium]